MTSSWDCGDPSACGPPVCGSTTPPNNPVEGNLWFDTGLRQWNLYTGGAWIPVASGGGGGGSGLPIPLKTGQILSADGVPLAWTPVDAFIEGNY